MARKPKKKRKVIEYHTFLNDDNGVTERDYLLLISTSVFFLFVAVGLIMLLFGKPIDEMYLRLVDLVTPVIMTIVASVFAIEGVEKVADGWKNKKEQEKEERFIEPIQVEEEYKEDEIL